MPSQLSAIKYNLKLITDHLACANDQVECNSCTDQKMVKKNMITDMEVGTVVTGKAGWRPGEAVVYCREQNKALMYCRFQVSLTAIEACWSSPDSRRFAHAQVTWSEISRTTGFHSSASSRVVVSS